MGCAASAQRRIMFLFGRNAHNSQEARARLERKLYLARESPEPDFDLSDCCLRRLPTGIFSICKVFRKDNLYLHNNRLQTLEEGGQLADLLLIKVLNLSCNQFFRLPNSIRHLTSLTELYLQNNFLECIPDGIKYLECLQVLDLSNNKLKHLNPGLGELKCLRLLKISDNKPLDKLCPELCLSTNLLSIELDCDNFTFPPANIVKKGTVEIMKYLCLEMNIEYVAPLPADISPSQVPNINYNPFEKQLGITWEEQEAAMIEQEHKIHKANQQQREKFLSKIMQEQQVLDSEIAKVQEVREAERQKLMRAIQMEEEEIECLIKNFIQIDRLQPEVIQQQLAYEQAEHDRLLEITRQNYDNIRRADVLKAMEELIEKDSSIQIYKKYYKDDLNNIKENMLIQETEGAMKLAELLNAKDESRTTLVQTLLEDQDIQKAIVSSLLEKVDAKSWSLNQEISLISTNLGRLSIIEQEKKNMHIAFNYNELLQQRIHLVELLDNLLDQRNIRRKQLIDTLKEVETEGVRSNDFWLKSYQKLLDSAPKTLFSVRKLDPVFANYLLQEGVIHCLPFLVKYLFSGESLLNITNQNLRESGVTLSSDRESILRALQMYVKARSQNSNIEPQPNISTRPSAPAIPDDEQNCSGVLNVDDKESSIVEGECVICMDAKSEVVFVPCGHMCCCQSCSQSELENCPMCRMDIERTIKTIVV